MKKRRLLFQIPTCPYCQRAIKELDAAGVQYEKVDVDPHDRSMVQLLSGQQSVPVMVEVTGCAEQDDDIVEEIPHLRTLY